MENYLHLQAKDLIKELGAIPPDTGLSVKFDDDTIQRAMRAKHVREVIERLQKTSTEVDVSALLLQERKNDFYLAQSKCW